MVARLLAGRPHRTAAQLEQNGPKATALAGSGQVLANIYGPALAAVALLLWAFIPSHTPERACWILTVLCFGLGFSRLMTASSAGRRFRANRTTSLVRNDGV
jgi:NAD(P)H-hydrate repair Nnr-like enzyme with NAD(P)H-hydrate dehydratase domain